VQVCKGKPAIGGPCRLKQAYIKRKCLKLAKSKPGGRVGILSKTHSIMLFIEIGDIHDTNEIDNDTVEGNTAYA